jgi:hypothetical protein
MNIFLTFSDLLQKKLYLLSLFQKQKKPGAIPRAFSQILYFFIV